MFKGGYFLRKLKSFSEVFYVVFSAAVVIICIFQLISSYTIMMYILIAIYIWIFMLTFRYKSFSIYQVFLITFFLFLLSRIFLDCIGLYDLRKMDLLQHTIMSDEIALKVLNILTIFLIGSSYAWLMTDKSPNIDSFKTYAPQFQFKSIIKILYYIYIVLFVLKMGYLLLAVRRYGYLALFNGTISENIRYPVIFTGVATITEVLFILLIYHERNEKSFKKYAILLIIAGFAKMLTGQRSYALVLLLYILYLWSTYYKEIKITNIKIIFIALVIPIIVQVIWNYRYDQNIDLLNILRNNVYVHLLEEQGCSIEVIAGTIINKDEFQNKIPFILGYFVDFVSGRSIGNQNIESIVNGNYLGYQLTYAINPTAYLAGRGTGTSYVAELYSSFGESLILLFITAFLSTKFVIFISNKAFDSLYYYGLSFYLLTDFIFSPRDSIFKSLGEVVFVWAISTMYLVIVNQGKIHIKKKRSSNLCIRNHL